MARIQYGVENPGFRPTDLLRPVQAVGHGAIQAVINVGRGGFLAAQAFRTLKQVDIWVPRFVPLMVTIGVASIPIALFILTFTGISSVSPDFGTSSIYNPGPHGLSEMLYAYSSAGANNGSAFGGISVNTKWYNTTLGLTMLFGRFFMIIPPLAIAGSLSRKKLIPPSLGTFPVTTPLFTGLLVGVILIVGALTFFPALSLGPIVEHFMMNAGQVF